jgi:tRNA-binding protein
MEQSYQSLPYFLFSISSLPLEMEEIQWSDFQKVALRVGTVVEVRDFPKAKKPAYQLMVDFGELGIKWSSAQITRHYTKEELLGRQIIGVVNFPEKQIANFKSQFLVTGFADQNGDIVLAAVEREVPNGSALL